MFRKFLNSNTEPESIALGLAIGAFICVLPLYGFHTLLVVLFAFLIPRANKIAILLGTNLSLPPTFPFITWIGYEIGRWVFWKNEYLPLGFEYFRHFDWKRLGDFYLPLFVGSFILGVVLFGFVYVIALNGIRWKRKRFGRQASKAD